MKITTRRRTTTIGGFRFDAARNRDGVVQLWADDDVALACGLGFAHALDRLVQMVLVRLVGQGRLGECLISDDETLAIDLFARGMGFRRDAEGDAANLTAETARFAEAYAAGVNHVIERCRRPLELVLIGHRPEPWTVADTLIHIKLISYVGLAQTQQDFEKLLIQAVKDGVSVARLKRLLAPHLDGLDEATVEHLRGLRWVDPLMPPEVRFCLPSVKASNNWAVAGARTASGSAIASYDPHLEVNRLPAVWYEAVLHTPDGYRMGITMPGVPGIVMGRTNHLAFGFTYGFMDMIDFFIEQCRDGRCRRGDRWVDIEVRTEEIRRRKKDPLQAYIRTTSHGVLEADPLREDLPDGTYLARAWSNDAAGASPSLEAMYRLPGARTVSNAQRLLREVTISCNWVLADTDGNVGYQQSGRLPKRHHSGLHPVPGWDPSLAWDGFVDADLLHRVLNPEEGFVATANQEINPPGGPTVVNLPMGSYRVDRIRAILAHTGSSTPDDMTRLQLDLYSLHAERFMALLEPLLPDGPAADLLRRWDRRYDRSSRAATLFEEIYQRLLRRVFGEGLFGVGAWDAIAATTTVLADYYHVFDDTLLGGDDIWFGKEGRDRVLASVTQEVLAGTDPDSIPTWGERQQVMMAHILLGGRLPRWLGFDRGPVQLEGNRATVVQGALFTFHGRVTTFSPSWRFVTDLGEHTALTALAGGPSGRRFSRYYVTDLERWLAGEYKTLQPAR